MRDLFMGGSFREKRLALKRLNSEVYGKGLVRGECSATAIDHADTKVHEGKNGSPNVPLLSFVVGNPGNEP